MRPTSLFLAIIGICSSISHILAFVATTTTQHDNYSPPRTKNCHVNDNDDDGDQSLSSCSSPLSSNRVSSRKHFLSITTPTSAFLGASILLVHIPIANAVNEPPNLYYDMEDPFVEFGKSSEKKSAGLGNGITSNAKLSSSQLSFSDIAFPSTASSPSTSSSTSSQEGGNLNNTLQNKVGESQKKRAINPLTHG
jgi:hypothetical protein